MTTIATPTAPHPSAQILSVNLVTGTIRFNWLDAAGQPVDSGNSVAPFTPGADWPTDADLATAITAATVA